MGKSGFEWEGDGATCHSTLTMLHYEKATSDLGLWQSHYLEESKLQ